MLQHCKLPSMTTGITLTNNKYAGAEDQVQRKWHKQLQSVLLWLLPEHSADQHMPHSSELSGISADTQPHTCQHNPVLRHPPMKPGDVVPDSAAASNSMQQNRLSSSHQQGTAGNAQAIGFDVAELYAAVKPQGNEPELSANNPKLRPKLRPYQKRAAAWMVAREHQQQVICNSR